MSLRRQPVARSLRRQPVAQARFVRRARSRSVTAPVGGWNARDALAQMAPTDAVSLINFFPRQSDLVSRPGSLLFCDTGEAGKKIQTLIEHRYGVVSKMIAAVNGKLIDVSTATPSSLKTGMSNDYYVWDTLGGYTFLANGVNNLQQFDGTTMADATFTGVTLSSLNFVEVYKNRIFAIEKNTQHMWYGGVGSVTGALTLFDFSVIGSYKGNLKVLARLKGDGGDGGNDDVFLAIFEGGDVVAYTGSDPSDPLNWSLLGQYKIGNPLSRFGIVDGDDNCYLLTSAGYVKLGEIAKYGQSAPERLAMSAKIQPAVLDDVSFIGPSDDWKCHIWPGGQMFIVNVPRPASSRKYHVRNINTGAWCSFKDLKAYSWLVHATTCYYGDDNGKVHVFSFNYANDNGAVVVADAQGAWNALQSAGYQKEVALVQVILQSSQRPPTMVTIGVDFQNLPITPYVTGDAGTFYYWDQCYWDQAYWFGKATTYRQWLSRTALGDMIGLRIRVQASQTAVSWSKTNIIYTLGGPL